jgi:hypothetical protein
LHLYSWIVKIGFLLFAIASLLFIMILKHFMDVLANSCELVYLCFNKIFDDTKNRKHLLKFQCLNTFFVETNKMIIKWTVLAFFFLLCFTAAMQIK